MAAGPVAFFPTAPLQMAPASAGAALLTPTQTHPSHRTETPDTAKLLQRALASSGTSVMHSLSQASTQQASDNGSSSGQHRTMQPASTSQAVHSLSQLGTQQAAGSSDNSGRHGSFLPASTSHSNGQVRTKQPANSSNGSGQQIHLQPACASSSLTAQRGAQTCNASAATTSAGSGSSTRQLGVMQHLHSSTVVPAMQQQSLPQTHCSQIHVSAKQARSSDAQHSSGLQGSLAGSGAASFLQPTAASSGVALQQQHATVAPYIGASAIGQGVEGASMSESSMSAADSHGQTASVAAAHADQRKSVIDVEVSISSDVGQ